VEDYFTDDIVSILPEDEKVQQISEYILNTYIKPDCDLPPSVWAMYSCSIIRTTNSCEAFHSKFNSMVYSAHPNIFQFIDVLKNVQKKTYIKKRNIHVIKNRQLMVCQKEGYLRQKMAKYDSGQLTGLNYIKVSFKFLPVF